MSRYRRNTGETPTVAMATGAVDNDTLEWCIVGSDNVNVWVAVFKNPNLSFTRLNQWVEADILNTGKPALNAALLAIVDNPLFDMALFTGELGESTKRELIIKSFNFLRASHGSNFLDTAQQMSRQMGFRGDATMPAILLIYAAETEGKAHLPQCHPRLLQVCASLLTDAQADTLHAQGAWPTRMRANRRSRRR